MAPPTNMPRLAQLDPGALALDTARGMRDHLQSQLISLAPLGDIPTIALDDDDLRRSEIYRAVRTLVGYARGDHGLDVPVQEYLISLIPLYSAPLGSANADGIDTDPSTDLGTVISAAQAREWLECGWSPKAVALAALAGVSYAQVRALVREGMLDEDGRARVIAKSARKWLSGRGITIKQRPKGDRLRQAIEAHEEESTMALAVEETRAARRERAKGKP